VTPAPIEGGASLMVAWRLQGCRVLVVGGGPMATERVRAVLAADGQVVLVSPTVPRELRQRSARGELVWHPRRWQPTDLDGISMVLAAPDSDSELLARAARARHIPVHVADKPELCDFWFPSVHRDGPVQIAVSTNGTGPALARRLRERLTAALPHGVGEAARRFGQLRRALREVEGEASARMAFLAQVASSWAWDRLSRLEDREVSELASRYRAGLPAQTARPPRRGRIRLVGAGPGDPELLTLAAARALEEADLVLADRLLPDAILARVRGELRIARKPPGGAQEGQDELDRAGIEAARAGLDVVRLKCGDPFVFGRGGEEILEYRAAGLEPEVIPGVTSALAAPLAAGIPATLRGWADRVVIATGQGGQGRTPTLPPFDPSATVLLLMAVGLLPELPARLSELGWPLDWPAAIVERGTHPDQRVERTTLAGLALVQSVRAPAVIVLGRVTSALVREETVAATG
jgi:uroporphyrin-III C-methyltransferase